MSPLFYKVLSIILSIVVFFTYILIFGLKPSQEHEIALRDTSKLKSMAGISLASSPYYKSNDFYLGMYKDNYMSFAYVK